MDAQKLLCDVAGIDLSCDEAWRVPGGLMTEIPGGEGINVYVLDPRLYKSVLDAGLTRPLAPAPLSPAAGERMIETGPAAELYLLFQHLSNTHGCEVSADEFRDGLIKCRPDRAKEARQGLNKGICASYLALCFAPEPWLPVPPKGLFFESVHWTGTKSGVYCLSRLNRGGETGSFAEPCVMISPRARKILETLTDCAVNNKLTIFQFARRWWFVTGHSFKLAVSLPCRETYAGGRKSWKHSPVGIAEMVDPVPSHPQYKVTFPDDGGGFKDKVIEAGKRGFKFVRLQLNGTGDELCVCGAGSSREGWTIPCSAEIIHAAMRIGGRPDPEDCFAVWEGKTAFLIKSLRMFYAFDLTFYNRFKLLITDRTVPDYRVSLAGNPT
jgi:hypothetical protein